MENPPTQNPPVIEDNPQIQNPPVIEDNPQIQNPPLIEDNPPTKYRSVFEDKYGLVLPYLQKFEFEDYENFDYTGYYDSDEEDVYGVTNVHETILKFFRQVRESWGFDVDCDPPSWFHAPFSPLDLPDAKESMDPIYDEVIRAAKFAIENINAEMKGKTYELVDVQKVVLSSNWMKYLTFTAKEVVADADADAAVKTFQATVHEKFDDTLTLDQWRFKPVSG